MTSRRVNNRLRLSAVERRGTGGLLRRCAPQGSGRDAVPWTNSRRVWGNRLPRQKQDGDPKVAVLWIKGPECVGAMSTRLNQSVVIFECFWVSFMNT